MNNNLKKKQYNFKRDQLVVKSNDLIQKARYKLSLEEHRVICYLISRISSDDTFFHEQTFLIRDYCDISGIVWQGGSTYNYIRDSLKSLRDKSFWIPIENTGKRTVSWFSYVEIYEDSGTVKVKFDDMMVPYLLFLRGKFTTYQLRNILAMRSRYGIRLYELLKSYSNLNEPIEFSLDRLKILLDAEIYDKFNHFKERVIEPAVKEINQFSDLNCTYIAEKDGRKIARIIFRVWRKNSLEIVSAFSHQERRLDLITDREPIPVRIKRE